MDQTSVPDSTSVQYELANSAHWRGNCSCGLCVPPRMLSWAPRSAASSGVPRGRPDLVLVTVQHVHGHTRGRECGRVGAQLREDAGDAHKVFRGRIERANALEFRPSDAGLVEVHVGEVGTQHLLARVGARGQRVEDRRYPTKRG